MSRVDVEAVGDGDGGGGVRRVETNEVGWIRRKAQKVGGLE